MEISDVSVVIPVYNASATLRRAVESVLGQTRPPKQVILVDDGSTDDLSEYERQYAGRVEWIRQSNQGAAAARNRGMTQASGRLIAFLDADDYWEPEKLEIQTDWFVRHPELDICVSRYYEQLPGGERTLGTTRIRRFPRFDTVLRLTGRDTFDAACCFWTGTVVVRREWLATNRFESGLEPAEDRDLWIRLVRGASMVHLCQPLATAVLEPGSLSRTAIDRDCRNMLRIVERWRSELGTSGVRFWRARLLRRWASEYLGQGEAAAALSPAASRLRLQPWSLEAWWIASKCVWLRLRERR